MSLPRTGRSRAIAVTALIFLAADPRVLPQRLYRLEHEGLGAVTIFLVPIAKDAEGVRYQATFN